MRVVAAVLAMTTAPSLAMAGTSTQGATAPKVAVLEFDVAKGVNIDRRYFANKVRGVVRERLPPDAFVMDRGSIETLLLAQGKTLGDCDTGCIVETGRRIGADFVISGEISQIGRLRLIMKLFDSRTGNLVAQAEATGKTQDRLASATGEAASRLIQPLVVRPDLQILTTHSETTESGRVQPVVIKKPATVANGHLSGKPTTGNARSQRPESERRASYIRLYVGDSRKPLQSRVDKDSVLHVDEDRDLVKRAATIYNVPPALVLAVMASLDRDSRPSGVGVMGLTAREYGEMYVSDPMDDSQSIMGGTRYLRYLANQLNGDMHLTVAAFYSSVSAVKETHGVPENVKEIVAYTIQQYLAFKSAAK